MKILPFLVALSLLATNVGEDRYFPDGSLGDDPEKHQSVHERYARMLKAFDEPSLMKAVENDDVKNRSIYRFTWLRSFHKPISIRLVKGDTITLTAKVLDGKGGYDPGKLATNVTVQISLEQFTRFESLLADADYRFLSPRVTDAGDWIWSPEDKSWRRVYGSGIDGAEWILESCSEDSYFFVQRWSPSKSRFGKACLYLVELSEVKVDDIY